MLRYSSIRISPLCWAHHPHLVSAKTCNSTCYSVLTRPLSSQTSLDSPPRPSHDYHRLKDVHTPGRHIQQCDSSRHYNTTSQSILLQTRPDFLSFNLLVKRFLRGRSRPRTNLPQTVDNLPERYAKTQDDVVPVVNQTMPKMKPSPPDEDSKIAKDLYAQISVTEPMELLDEVSM